MNDLIAENRGHRALLEVPIHEQEDAIAPLRRGLGAVWSNRWLAAITALVIFMLVVGAGLLLNRSRYAEAMLEIQPGHENLEQPNQRSAEVPPDTSAIDTEVEILRSPVVAEAVVQKLNLTQDPEFNGQAKPGLLRRVMIALGAGAGPQESDHDATRQAVTAVMSHSRIRRIGLTYMVRVGFVAGDMQKAQNIANAIATAYIQIKLDRKLAAVKRANEDLGVTLEGLRRKALDAEARLEEYIAKNGSLGTDSANLAEGELTSLNEKLAEAHANAVEAMTAAKAAQQHQQSGSNDNTLAALRTKEAETSASLAQLETQFGPEYPAVKRSQAELKDIRDEIESESGRVLATLGAQARVAEQREAAIMASRDAVEQKIQTNNQARVELLPLKQAADSAKTIYETYLQRASEVTAQRGLQQVDANLESKAVPGPASIFSRPIVIGFLAAILALAGSLITVMLVELWSPRVRSLTDVRREAGVPVLGLLPDMSTRDHDRATAAYLTEKPFTVVAEAFRSLSAYLAITPRRGMDRVITVTSAVPNEGKSMVSIGLAETLAAQGARVLLMDCDLRNPSTSAFFTRPQYGLTEVIQRGIPVERAMMQDVKSGIWFLGGTSAREIPPFLFTDKKLDALLAQLTQQFDHIIIDTLPILGFADARILAAKAGQVLLVVRWNKTPASTVRAAMAVLRLCNARVIGTVLNKVDVDQQAVYGFADGSDYYHHYGSAYKLT